MRIYDLIFSLSVALKNTESNMYKAFKEKLDRPIDSVEKEEKDMASSSMTMGKEEVVEAAEENKKDVVSDLHIDEGIKTQWEKEQLLLKQKLKLEDIPEWAKQRVTPENVEDHPGVVPLEYLGGVDISFVKGDDVNACAALTVVQLPSLEIVYEDYKMIELTAPYIPGFLAFREAPFLVEMFQTLQEKSPQFTPQVILCDGNGILHPREFGIACHLGVLLNLPTLGAAKKLFQVDGLEKDETHKEKISNLGDGHDRFPLVGDSGTVLGVAFKSNDKTRNPIYISPGHMMSLDTAVWVVELCCKHRVPEPVRQADIGSRKYLRENFKSDENQT